LKSPESTRRVIETLAGQHPNADTELHYRNAFELLVATILSAQSTDARVNMVTPKLFAKYPDAPTLARARQATLEKQIVSTGFFRQKSKALLSSLSTAVRSRPTWMR
jgi:endonuclease III